MSTRSKVRIPGQLQGSENMQDMHPDQYYIDDDGDQILLLRNKGLSLEGITEQMASKGLTLARVKGFMILADRKLWWQITGEVSRDVPLITRKLGLLLDHSKYIV